MIRTQLLRVASVASKVTSPSCLGTVSSSQLTPVGDTFLLTNDDFFYGNTHFNVPSYENHWIQDERSKISMVR